MYRQHRGSFVKLFEVNFMYSKHGDDYLFYFFNISFNGFWISLTNKFFDLAHLLTMECILQITLATFFLLEKEIGIPK